MPTAVVLYDGEYVNYTPATNVAAGDVFFMGHLFLVATRPVPANTEGAFLIRGIVQLPKATGTGKTISAGALVYWDAANNVATATAIGGTTAIGKAVAAAGATDSTVKVLLTPENGYVYPSS